MISIAPNTNVELSYLARYINMTEDKIWNLPQSIFQENGFKKKYITKKIRKGLNID